MGEAFRYITPALASQCSTIWQRRQEQPKDSRRSETISAARLSGAKDGSANEKTQPGKNTNSSPREWDARGMRKKNGGDEYRKTDVGGLLNSLRVPSRLMELANSVSKRQSGKALW